MELSRDYYKYIEIHIKKKKKKERKKYPLNSYLSSNLVDRSKIEISDKKDEECFESRIAGELIIYKLLISIWNNEN